MSPNNDDSANTDSMPAASETSLDIEALSPRQLRVVLVCDVVESVRWMEHDEDNAITRWSQFAAAVRSRIAPEHKGSVVKSTGDGLMLEFESAPQAVAAANAMQKLANEGNAGFDAERQMHLRIGIHQAQVRRDAHDLYGHGVNLAARISTLAGPGEIIVTPEVRDHLTDSLDGDIEDMGECYLKHLSEPQRVYRVGGASHQSVLIPQSQYNETLLPTIAVIPFENRVSQFEYASVGNLIADGVIACLASSQSIKIISRLSTSVFRDRSLTPNLIGQHLKATHILSGAYDVFGSDLYLTYELSDTDSGQVLNSHRIKSSFDDLLAIDGDSVRLIASEVCSIIQSEESNRVEQIPLPNLKGYSLLQTGIRGIHLSPLQQFSKARDVFEHLIDRHPKASEPRAWFAKWFVLNALRQTNEDRKSLAIQALRHTQTVLHYQPENSLALCMEGFVHAHLTNDFHLAEKRLNSAIQINPNESMAWLISSVVSSLNEKYENAVLQSSKALALSPVDPLRYFFLSLHASALLSANDAQSAISHATQSLRLNRHHAPTLRVLLTAQVQQGAIEQAKKTLSQLMLEQPDLTVTSYEKAGAMTETRRQCAHALRVAGLHET